MEAMTVLSDCMEPIEVWKDIDGYPSYKISNYGRIKSFKQNKNGKILKPAIDQDGYFRYRLYKYKPDDHMFYAHRLVAIAFIQNPGNLPQVNHIDGNKQNNYTENLEWCTTKYNINHFYKLHPEALKRYCGEKSNSCKLSSKEVLEIFDLSWHSELSLPQIAEKFHTTKGNVWVIKWGITWDSVTSDSQVSTEAI